MQSIQHDAIQDVPIAKIHLRHLFDLFSNAAERWKVFSDQKIFFVATLLRPFRHAIVALAAYFLLYSFLTSQVWRIWLLLVGFHLLCAAVLQRYYCTETDDNGSANDDVEEQKTADVDTRDARLKRFDIAGV